jgi:hypothetical protein
MVSEFDSNSRGDQRSGLTYLVVDLRDLHRVARRATAADHGERSRAVDGVGDVALVVGGVEVLAVPAAVTPVRISSCASTIASPVWVHIHGEDDARADTTRAGPVREGFRVALRVKARRLGVTLEVGAVVAAVAALDLAAEVGRRAPHHVTREHAEALSKTSASLVTTHT